MSRFKLISYCIALLLILSTPVSQSAPKLGGFTELPMGSRVEGSAAYGGIQPDYEISESDSDLKEFLAKVRERMGESSIFNAIYGAEWAKVVKVHNLIQKTLPDTDYDSKAYLQLLKSYREKGQPIPLGAYIQCGAGVCREYALLTHLALKEAGIKNQFVYAKVPVGGGELEDHAFVVVKEKSHLWIVDPYFPRYHGLDLNELVKGERARSKAPFVLGLKDPSTRIVEINNYPKYWVPKKCAEIFGL